MEDAVSPSGMATPVSVKLAGIGHRGGDYPGGVRPTGFTGLCEPGPDWRRRWESTAICSVGSVARCSARPVNSPWDPPRHFGLEDVDLGFFFRDSDRFSVDAQRARAQRIANQDGGTTITRGPAARCGT